MQGYMWMGRGMGWDGLSGLGALCGLVQHLVACALGYITGYVQAAYCYTLRVTGYFTT